MVLVIVFFELSHTNNIVILSFTWMLELLAGLKTNDSQLATD